MTLLRYNKTHVEGQEDNSFPADDKRAILNKANKNVENKQKTMKIEASSWNSQ